MQIMNKDLTKAEQEERFKNAFETSPIGMALVSLEGEWMHVNKAITEIVGYSKEELLKKTFQDITHEDDLEKDLQQVKKMLDGSIKTYQMEKRYYRKDGSIVWVLLSVSLVRSEDDAPLYFVSQIQNLNELKEAQEELVERDKDFNVISDIIDLKNKREEELKKEVDALRIELGKEPKYGRG